jgi:hypothetical protein
MYESLTDTWMWWKLGLIPSNSFSGNIFFEFFGIVSLQCSCSREYPCKFSPNYPLSLQCAELCLTFSSLEYLARFILCKDCKFKIITFRNTRAACKCTCTLYRRCIISNLEFLCNIKTYECSSPLSCIPA